MSVNTWQIGDGTNTITLPFAPTNVKVSLPFQLEEFTIEGQGTALISRFPKSKTVTLSGALWVTGSTNQQLITNFLTQLESWNRKVVQLSDPDNQFFTSAGWLFSFDYTRKQEGKEVIYRYNMIFREATGTNVTVVLI